MGWKVKKGGAWLDLLLLLTGQYAMVRILEEVKVLNWDSTWGLRLGWLALCLLWGLYHLPGRWPALAAMGVMGTGSLLYLLGNEAVQAQLTQILGSFGGNVTGVVTGAMTWLLLWVAMLLFLVEIILGIHWPLLIAGAALPLACPFLGIPLNLPGVFALMVFLLGFWLWKRLGTPGKKLPAERQAGRRFRRLGAGLLAGICGLFWLSCMGAEAAQQTLYTVPYQVEALVMETFRKQTGDSLNLEDGSVSRGNVYPSGTIQLKVVSQALPTATIYLRQSFRGDYQNGQWGEDWDEEIFDRIEASGGEWGQWNGSPQTVLQTLVYDLNSRFRGVGSQGLWISLVKNPVGEKPMPYFSREAENSAGGKDYVVHYYPISLLGLPWERIQEEEPWNRELMRLYRQEARNLYTRLPATGLSRLRQLCQANPMESLEEITMFIYHTLNTYASYTQAPGMFPLNQDPVEYFLFDIGRGYCQHFASAAVLLYRMYGIPARYATGYSVSPSDFVQVGEQYSATVTDESAHAWVEIYLTDYGWTPVEMTPGGDTLPELPGVTSRSLQEILDNQHWDYSMFQPPEATQPQTLPEFSPVRPQGQGQTVNLLPLLWTGAVLLLILGWYVCRRLLLARLKKLRPGALYARLIAGLHFGGLLTGCDGQEADFGAQLAAVLPELKTLDMDKMLLLVNRDVYGQEPPEEGEAQALLAFYQTAMKLAADRLPFWKRVIFRFCKMYV